MNTYKTEYLTNIIKIIPGNYLLQSFINLFMYIFCEIPILKSKHSNVKFLFD